MGKSKLTETEKGKTGEGHGQEHAHHIPRHEEGCSYRICSGPIPHTTLPFYGDCVKMSENFATNLGEKRTGSFITTKHHLIRELFNKNNMTVVSRPSYSPDLAPCDFSVASHFDTTEVTEAESQVVLNNLKEPDFQDAFNNNRSPRNGAYAQKGGYFKGDCGQ
jgi:hypothetical protein